MTVEEILKKDARVWFALEDAIGITLWLFAGALFIVGLMLILMVVYP